MKRSVLGGTSNQRIHALAITAADERKCDGEAEIGDKWEWMRWIDRQRGQQGENLPKKMLLQPRLFLFTDIRTVHQHDAMLGQQAPELAPALLLIAGKRCDCFTNARKLLGRR